MSINEVGTTLALGGLNTLQIALGAWATAAVFGLLLAVLRDSGPRPLGPLLTLLVTLLRSIPQLVILYILFFGLATLGIQLDSVLAAILALGIAEAAFAAEYYRAGFMTVPQTQRDAGHSLGLSSLGVMRLVVIPQTIPYVVPPLLNSLTSLLKYATLASAVGAPEILYQGQAAMNRTGWIVQIAAVIIVVYLVLTLPLTRLVTRFEIRARTHAAA